MGFKASDLSSDTRKECMGSNPISDIIYFSFTETYEDSYTHLNEESFVANEVHVIYLQQRYFLKQTRWVTLPVNSDARNHLDVKLKGLKYKIEMLEKYNFENIREANFNYAYIREKAERLYLKSLREKVFINKRLITIPRWKQ